MKTAPGNPRKNSVLNVVLTMMLILFVSLLAFCSGLYLGKQLTDSEYQLKALEGDFGKGSKMAANAEAAKTGEAAPTDVINDEDIEKMSEKFVSSEKTEENQAPKKEDGRSIASTSEKHGEKSEEASDAHADAKPEAKPDAHADSHGEAKADHEAPAKHEVSAHAAAPAKSEKPDLSAAHRAASRVANNAAPGEASKVGGETAHEANRVPTSLPKTVGTSSDVEFTVQVASYPTIEAAKEKSSELQQKGFVSFPVPAQVNGKTWYRVSVGSFKSQKEATTYRAEFLKKTGLSTAIVQKITR